MENHWTILALKYNFTCVNNCGMALKGQCDEKGSNKGDSAARLGAIKGQCVEIGSNKGTVQREREQ